MTPEEFARIYPRLYHMTEAGAWRSILKHGLLSASRILDRCEIREPERELMEGCLRAQHALVSRRHFQALLHDQVPMSEAGLRACLDDGMTPRDWLKTLNSRVFFWVSEQRLARLLNARNNRNRACDVLLIDTLSLLRMYRQQAELSPINSGATKPFPARRGRQTFLPLALYPFDYWRGKRPLHDAVVELTVRDAVLDIGQYLLSVERRSAGHSPVVLWCAEGTASSRAGVFSENSESANGE
jgi:hypothetical protein